MSDAWCPNCTRRIIDKQTDRCPFCSHAGLQRWSFFLIICEDAWDLFSILVPLSIGIFTASCVAVGWILFSVNTSALFCFAGGMSGTLLAPDKTMRAAVLASFPQLLVYLPFAIAFVAFAFFSLVATFVLSAYLPALAGAIIGRLLVRSFALLSGDWRFHD
jgi:hypothetical protein